MGVVSEQPGVVYFSLEQGTGQVAQVDVEDLVGKHFLHSHRAGQADGEDEEHLGDQISSICVPHLVLFQLVWYRLSGEPVHSFYPQG